MYSDTNAENLVLRIRIKLSEEDKAAEAAEYALGHRDDEFLRRLQRDLLESLHLQGVPGIQKVYTSNKKRPHWNPALGFTSKQEWIIETDGTNLMEVLAVPGIDPTRTHSNDVVEMFYVFGIEGVRAGLFHE